MKTYSNISRAHTHQFVSSNLHQAAGGKSAACFIDNRPGSVAQMQLIDAMARGNPVQRAKNNTGLPEQLKSGVENLSGQSMDDVKVHYNSDKPTQLNAYAYAQGSDIHLAPGQEKHLPHEAWHVVQQKQGRVQPTMQMRGKVNVNDDKGLEKEADVMGAKANSLSSTGSTAQLLLKPHSNQGTVQRKVGFEFESRGTKIVKDDGELHEDEKAKLINTSLFNVESDNGYFEIVTPAFDEPGGKGSVEASMAAIERLVVHLESEKGRGQEETSLGTLIGLAPENQEDVNSVVPHGTELAHNRNKQDVDFIGVTPEWGIRLTTDHILSHPQATVGIRLDKTGSLLNMLALGGQVSGKASEESSLHSWDTKNNFGADAQKRYVSQAVANVNAGWGELAQKYHLSKEFKGFLIIVSTYLVCAHEAKTHFEDAKGIAPFMSRVNLADVAANLSDKDLAFMSYRRAPTLVMRLAGVGDNESPMYRHKFSEAGLYTYNEETRNLPNLTNRQWLKQLFSDKVDKLSEFGESISEVSTDEDSGGRSLEDFHMENATDIGHNRKGMVMEIRRLPRNLPVSEWTRVAKKVYDIVEMLNRSKR